MIDLTRAERLMIIEALKGNAGRLERESLDCPDGSPAANVKRDRAYQMESLAMRLAYAWLGRPEAASQD